MSAGRTTDPRAVLTRPAPAPDLVVAYGELPDQVADVRLPPGTSARAPLVVMLHGGFWRSEFDRRHTGPMCTDLAARGYATAALEYRRTGSTGGGWPATFDDIAAATDRIADLVAEAAPGRVDPEQMVLVGHSAGGHLALWAAARHRLPAEGPAARWRREHPLKTRGVVPLAPVAALESASRAGLGEGATDALLGGTPVEVPDRYAMADPMHLVPSGARTVIVHGDHDDRVPIGNSREYVNRAQAAGDDVALLELTGIEHFGVIDPESAAWPIVVDAIASLLGEDA